jgi:homoaconitase/3-isopropylmalate dehydratase large subunit
MTLKKISTIIAVVLLVASMAPFALAAGTLNGKVTKVESDKITVAIEGALPAWVKTGATVMAAGSTPKVLSVKGNGVTLRFSKANAAKIKVGSRMTLSEFPVADSLGC